MEKANAPAMSAPIQLHAIPPIGIFKHVDADIRRRLVQAGEFKVVPAHTPLATQGEPHSEMSLIISGKVGIYAHANAQTVQLAELGAGQTVGEMAVIDPHPASADVVVLERAELWAVSREKFERFLQSDCAAGYELMHLLAKELCHRLRMNSETMLRQAEQLKDSFLDRDY